MNTKNWPLRQKPVYDVSKSGITISDRTSPNIYFPQFIWIIVPFLSGGLF